MSMTIPESLPIAAYAKQLVEAIRAHQVLIVCGDTGSGKTTQLPKLAQLARPDAQGWIGVTQPRRLAAIAMARRLADELHAPVGSLVGYQHRFEKKLSQQTRYKFMTDGILLAETRTDPRFKAYSTIIIDEAHERSLNIDFLLGLLKRLLPKRPDLRVIISSATLDAELFSHFFDNAPVITIPGRLYPIETIYLPEADAEDDDMPRRIANAVDALGQNSGDILVFLPGEHDIRETLQMLESRHLPRTEVLPLLASLPAGEQARIFQSSSSRRIILATNVAETSVTIPGIRCVIDSGLARIKRYSAQRHIQQLKVEPIAQASARQRMGRCGRVGPGTCIRLYSEEDYARREAHTAPEIRRSALAGVILTMVDLHLGDIATFPFIEPPTGVAIREGYRELLELGAIAQQHERVALTSIGRALSSFPLEPRFARILLAAESECILADALTVVAALACDEPLLRPLEKRDQADAAHSKFRSSVSDFSARLKLWAWYHDPSQGTSETLRRKRCKATFISYPKMREWINIRAQLEQLCKARKLHIEDTRGGEAGLHRALLCGLLSRIGHYDSETRDYRGAFAIRFNIFPGSGLAKVERKKPLPPGHKPPKPLPDALPTSREWVLAGELVETSRLFARSVSCIDPRWIEPIAGALCKVHHHSAFWDAAKGFVRVHEDVTLFGLPLASGRLRDLSRIAPADARAIFIADALVVPEAVKNPPRWLQENWQRQQLLEQVLALQRVARDELHERLVAFYDAHLPADVCSAPSLKRCPALPLRGEEFALDAAVLKDFPTEISVGGEKFPLIYSHDPEASEDGLTIVATPENAHLLRDWHGEWLVPGLLPDKLRWMLSLQPARVRHVLGDLGELRDAILSHVTPYKRPLSESLFRYLRDERGVRVDESLWDESKLPSHLRLNYRIQRDEDGQALGQGRVLEPLLALFAPSEPTIKADIKDIADPALARLHRRQDCIEKLRALGGNRWSMYEQLPSLPHATKAFLKAAAIDPARLGKEIFMLALTQCFLSSSEDPETESALQVRYSAQKGRLASVVSEWRKRVLVLIAQAASLETFAMTATGIYPATLDQVLDQLAWLVFDGFVSTVPPEELLRYQLYLDGIADRLDRAHNNPAGDLKKAEPLLPRWQRYVDFMNTAKKPRFDALALSSYRWQMEVWRLCLFCPQLTPPSRPTAKSLDALWEKVLQP